MRIREYRGFPIYSGKRRSKGPVRYRVPGLGTTSQISFGRLYEAKVAIDNHIHFEMRKGLEMCEEASRLWAKRKAQQSNTCPECGAKGIYVGMLAQMRHYICCECRQSFFTEPKRRHHD